ncbi:ABC transporter substrate-binding protein [Aquicoccus sp. G2-2]|uniref:ABC transporter substrate-binding protein n=1 Tax=Aquicoccus sp. G2-2 TaxID=3092120 RepID=UPI00366B9307
MATANGAPPKRVVSINLCTDQLAMLIAQDGQLVSISDLASDPRSSAMVNEAANYPVNHGLAEEIYLLRPDLVLAGRYARGATVSMLRRLGIPVVVFDGVTQLDEIPARLRQMGDVLGQPAKGKAQAAGFERRLAGFRAEVERHPRAALYAANSYTLGDQTLAGHILLAAGFGNVAADLGLHGGGTLPLEVLAMQAPDALVTSQPFPGASRSEEVLHHPIIEQMRRSVPGTALSGSDWICGTPFVLDAVADMVTLREQIEKVGEE